MDILSQGFTLMVVGMATVFAFLVLLIGAMNASANFFKKHAHRGGEPTVSAEPPDADMAEIAVALAAIKARYG